MAKLMAKIFKRAVTWNKLPFGTAVVAAAGSSQRMEGEDKLFAEVGGIPVLARSLRELEASPNIHEIIVVTREESIIPVADMCAEFEITKATKILCGGEDRLESVLIGLNEADESAEYIAVHDGARPLVTQDIIKDAFSKAYKFSAACPMAPVTDTVKTVKDGFIIETPTRDTLYAAQTPQVVKADVLKAALQNARQKGLSVTDDCGAVEAIGLRPAVSLGSHENIKITRREDLALAEAIIEARRAI